MKGGMSRVLWGRLVSDGNGRLRDANWLRKLLDNREGEVIESQVGWIRQAKTPL